MQKMNLKLKGFDGEAMSSLLEAELASLKNDELVYPVISQQLHLTRKETETFIAALLDFQEDVHYCANCPGLDHCDKPHPHFTLRLEREGEVVVRRYGPCPKMVSLVSFRERYIRCTFPEEWRDEDVRSIEKSVSARKEAIIAMANAIKNNTGDWFYFYGKAGSGRSFMLACLANTITKKGGIGAFSDTGTLLDELKDKSINDKPGFNELMKKLSTCDILVLDDFGNEFKSEFVYTSILYPLLAARDRDGLLTAFASDFKPEQIISMYRSKIGPERADQLKYFFSRRCPKPHDVTSIKIY